MKGNVSDFIGSWNVSWVAGRYNVLVQDYTMLIGTGSEYGDTAPELSPDNEVCVGFAVLDGAGNTVIASDQFDPPQLLYYLYGGTLYTEGPYAPDGGDPETLRLYISAAEAVTETGASLSLYGTTIFGDPDQVGVWGAEGQPPPEP